MEQLKITLDVDRRERDALLSITRRMMDQGKRGDDIYRTSAVNKLNSALEQSRTQRAATDGIGTDKPRTP